MSEAEEIDVTSFHPSKLTFVSLAIHFHPANALLLIDFGLYGLPILTANKPQETLSPVLLGC